MQRRRVADCGEPEETRLALMAQPLERRHHVTEHLSDAERFAAPSLGDRIVQMEDVDPIAAKPRQTGFERLRHGVGNVAEVGGRQPDLGADDDVGRFELLQDAAEILFGFAVAVLHRGVEVVHAGGERACDGALLVEWFAAHHQSADRAAAEAQHRKLHSGAAEYPHFRRSSVCAGGTAQDTRSRPQQLRAKSGREQMQQHECAKAKLTRSPCRRAPAASAALRGGATSRS